LELLHLPRVERAVGRAEERRALADDALDRRGAAIDLRFELVAREARELAVVVRVVADEVPRRRHLTRDGARGDRAIGVAVEVLPDPEERAAHVVLREEIEDLGRR